MRVFYIFEIKREMACLTKDTPYMLFKSLEAIFNSDKNDYYVATSLYNQLVNKINKEYINRLIRSSFKDSVNYNTTLDYHYYNNKYKDEDCEVNLNNTYLVCKTSSNNFILLKKFVNENFFVCDFENKDYFWLKEIYS